MSQGAMKVIGGLMATFILGLVLFVVFISNLSITFAYAFAIAGAFLMIVSGLFIYKQFMD